MARQAGTETVNPRTKYNPGHACEKKNGGSHSKLTLARILLFRQETVLAEGGYCQSVTTDATARANPDTCEAQIAMTGDRSLFYCSQSLISLFLQHTDHRGFLVFREAGTALSNPQPSAPPYKAADLPVALHVERLPQQMPFLLLTGAMY